MKLAKVCQAERGYTLKENCESIIGVRRDYLARWYWYGIERNYFLSKEQSDRLNGFVQELLEGL